MLVVMDALLVGRNGQVHNNPEKVREFSGKYGEEDQEERKAYNQEYNRREVECGCKVTKCNWL